MYTEYVVFSVITMILIMAVVYMTFATKRDKDENFRSVPDLRFAISIMTKNPHDIEFWLHYHIIVMNAYRIYIHIENTTGLRNKIERWCIKNDRETCVVIVEDTTNTTNRDAYDALQDRQHTNVKKCIQLARTDKCHYLFHIDDDELIVVSKKYNCSIIKLLLKHHVKWAKYSDVHFQNYEATIVSDTKQDHCFVNKTYRFSPCHTHYCRSYANGKSMGNLSFESLKPNGPHSFSGSSIMVDTKDAIILHFDSCTFEKWIDKFQNLSNVSEKVFRNIPFSFYKDSIQQIQKCSTSCQRTSSDDVDTCMSCMKESERLWTEYMAKSYETANSLDDLNMCSPFTRVTYE